MPMDRMLPKMGKHLTFDGFHTEIARALEAREPYCFTRYGDGEGIILGYPQYTSQTTFAKRINKWFPIATMGTDSQRRFADQMRQSVAQADMLGIPAIRHAEVNIHWRSVHEYFNKFGLVDMDQLVCSMDGVLHLQRKGLYPKLFKDHDEVACITCRDVKGLLRDKLGFKEINMLYTPPQVRPFKGPVMTKDKHYPTIYQRVKPWIESVHPKGKLFLVGAGGMGKVYSMWIKEAGGIAFDIGSVLDGWAGVNTRSHIAREPDTWRLK